MKKIWTKYQDIVPCKECDGHLLSMEENQHVACQLWNKGWRVGLRKFLWFKWLEFTKYSPSQG